MATIWSMPMMDYQYGGEMLSDTFNETMIINTGCHENCPENCPPNNWMVGKGGSNLFDSNIEIQCGNEIFEVSFLQLSPIKSLK